jgi:hypothetical protein
MEREELPTSNFNPESTEYYPTELEIEQSVYTISRNDSFENLKDISPLLVLPTEILVKIFGYLTTDFRDLGRLGINSSELLLQNNSIQLKSVCDLISFSYRMILLFGNNVTSKHPSTYLPEASTF